MNDTNMYKGYGNFVLALMLLFPVFIISVKIVGNLILLILVFMGIYIFIKEKKSPFMIPELKLFSWLTFGYFLVMMLSVMQNEGFVSELYHLGRKAHFLLAPFIALAIYKAHLPFERLILSIKVGVFVIGAIAIYQKINGAVNASGMFNSNIFGDLALIMAFFSTINFFKEKLLSKLFTVLSLCLGIYAVVASGSRGTLLMMFIISIVYLLIIIKSNSHINKQYKLLLVAVFALILFGITNTNSFIGGFQRASDSIEMWTSGDVTTSSGMRLEMWVGSIDAFKESPWLGHGYRNANMVVSNYVEPTVSGLVAGFTHLHNEYITHLISAGIVGLISLLLLLFVPFKVFIDNMNNSKSFPYSFMGLILCSSYALIGMTHIAFGEEHVNAFFIYFLAILLPNVIKESNSIGLDQPKEVHIAN